MVLFRNIMRIHYKSLLPCVALRGLFTPQQVNASASSRWRFYSTRSATNKKPDDDFHLDLLDGDMTGVAIMSMRRFRYKNAMGKHFIKRFLETMDEVKFNNKIRIVILRSEVPGVFCAGADLKERLLMTNDEVTACVAELRFSTTQLHNLPMPTIAAIDGAALGGGLEMALACDVRVAGGDARIGLIETTHAIMPGAGGTQRLPRVIGAALAKELIFTGRVLNGWKAKEYGVVNHCVEQNSNGDAAFHKAMELAEEMLPNGPIGQRMAKAAVNRGIEVEIEAGMRYEEAYYAQVIPTKDRIEGLLAFKEKRKPKYEGH